MGPRRVSLKRLENADSGAAQGTSKGLRRIGKPFGGFGSVFGGPIRPQRAAASVFARVLRTRLSASRFSCAPFLLRTVAPRRVRYRRWGKSGGLFPFEIAQAKFITQQSKKWLSGRFELVDHSTTRLDAHVTSFAVSAAKWSANIL